MANSSRRVFARPAVLKHRMAGLRITLRGCHKKRRRPLPRGAFVETQCPALQLGWCETCAGLCLRIVAYPEPGSSPPMRWSLISCARVARPPHAPKENQAGASSRSSTRRNSDPSQKCPPSLISRSRSSGPPDRLCRGIGLSGTVQRKDRTASDLDGRHMTGAPFAILSSGALRVSKAVELKRSFVLPAALPSAHRTAGA